MWRNIFWGSGTSRSKFGRRIAAVRQNSDVCEYVSLSSVTMEFINSSHDGKNASISLGIMLNNNNNNNHTAVQ
jgi:hypothetical protein